MLMIDNIKNYLYDQDYCINIYKDYLYFFNYLKIITINKSFVSIEFSSFIINIKGDNFKVKKMAKTELLIQGNLLSLEKSYEK